MSGHVDACCRGESNSGNAFQHALHFVLLCGGKRGIEILYARFFSRSTSIVTMRRDFKRAHRVCCGNLRAAVVELFRFIDLLLQRMLSRAHARVTRFVVHFTRTGCRRHHHSKPP